MVKDVAVERSDLVFIFRATDQALSELQAAVADGLVKEDVALDLEQALEIVREYINNAK